MEKENHPARFWSPAAENAVRCTLCPRTCLISDGKCGYCGIRKNIGGSLVSQAYGRPTAIQVDPIEKKPLRHYLPGTRIFSVGCFGCNLGCVFCQNDSLSRGSYGSVSGSFRYFAPEELVRLAKEHQCRSIAFTYNEPTIWTEYVIDTFRVAKESGLGTVLVSNAFIGHDAAMELFPLTDAANFDVKGFSKNFYEEMCGGTLAPVLESCILFRNTFGKHMELTNLIIPGKNSDPADVDAFLDWVEASFGNDVPLHFSAYFPAYKYHASPRTPPSMLHDIRARAVVRGFTRIYLGNI